MKHQGRKKPLPNCMDIVLGYQLTLFGPRGADYACHITTCPPPHLFGGGGISALPQWTPKKEAVRLLSRYCGKHEWKKNPEEPLLIFKSIASYLVVTKKESQCGPRKTTANLT